MTERLHKVLAQHGLGSRRELEGWIADGRILLNGKAAQVGDRFTPGDRVIIDGKDITARLRVEAVEQVLLYHKPQGQPLERGDDPEIESVIERLPAHRGVRWVPINPMHPGDSGLLLLTNDGALSYALTRHKREIPAAYMVRLHAPGGAQRLPELPHSLRYDEETVEFSKVEPAGGDGENIWFRVELARADRRAAVRALFVSNGLTVSRMMQVAFAGIELPKDLPRSRHRLLPSDQMAKLYEAAQAKMPQQKNVGAQAGGRRFTRSADAGNEPPRKAAPSPDRRVRKRSRK